MEVAKKYLDEIVEKLRFTYNERPRTIAVALGLGAASTWAYSSYHAFINHIGKETKLFLPAPIIWIIAVASAPFAKETTGTAVYNQDDNKEVWLSKDIPQRKGNRPSWGDFVAPHRQRSQIPNEEFRKVRLPPISCQQSVTNYLPSSALTPPCSSMSMPTQHI